MDPTVILIGPAGAGKGTVAVALKEERGYHHISTGDILRKKRKTDPEFALKIDFAKMDAGKYLPDKIITEIAIKEIDRVLKQSGVPLLDGAIRTRDQSIEICDHLEHLEKPVVVINMEIDREVATYRLIRRGREDDKPLTIKTREEEDSEKLKSAIEYLRRRFKLSFYTIYNNNKDVDALQAEALGIVDAGKARIAKIRSVTSLLGGVPKTEGAMA